MKMESFVMPAWTAGTQIRKDASREIHVNLDCSSPCRNFGGLQKFPTMLIIHLMKRHLH
jgi:hypothetical protein